jgi:serine/threonine-protein kinase HipA
MPLHLVGQTIDRFRAFAAAQSGDFVSLYRGIYVDATDDIERVVPAHGVRIAAFLYPQAYLSSASAVRLAPLADGRLFLSGRRNARTRIRNLEIIQNQAPDHPSTTPVIVGDDLGEIALTASSPRQRFLEAFRRQSEHAAAIDPEMRREMADRLLAEYRTPQAAADALWDLARPMRWTREAEAAEHYLQAGLNAAPTQANRARIAFTVAWHGEAVGQLAYDGAEWRWFAAPGGGPPLIRETRPGSLPPFIEALLPEGWLAQVLAARDDRDLLRSGSRYMSNITIVDDLAELTILPADIVEGRLGLFQENGRFTGDYQGPGKRSLEDSFQQRLAAVYASPETPRLSGIQIKAPMCLRRDGVVIVAQDAPFTHILKPAGTQGYEDLPIIEWINLQLARGAGFQTAEAALIDMPGGIPPALLVERFDIRRSDNDPRRLAMEDFCSVLDQPPARKYDGTIERMARGMRPLSTDPAADLETLFLRALFAWLIADGDMHLKNLALLKIAEPASDRFGSVRLAPVYDAVTTIIVPGLEHDRMALKLNGKDSRLTPEDFATLARTIELPLMRTPTLMATCARRLVDSTAALRLPPPFQKRGDRVLDQIRRIVAERADPFL